MIDQSAGTVAPPVAGGATVDLTNCDKEPIHIPGAIQPYGALLGVDERTAIVRVASESAQHHLGLAADRIVGSRLAKIVGEETARALMSLAIKTVDRATQAISIKCADKPCAFDAVVHRSDGLAVIELIPIDNDNEATPASPMRAMTDAMRGALAAVERAGSLPEVADAIAREMRTLTGFDRVWVYRFHPDWHGEIIGEARRPDIETWLGMHYPASDIPAQARALFLRNWVRVIPDVAFAPSPLTPVINPVTGVPLNLGNSILRSVSPIHIQYLKNMGVSGSLVISLIYQGKLWGLISGHHYSGPRLVSPEIRAACEFLAYALSLQVGTVARLERGEHALELRRRQSAVIEQLSAAADIREALAESPVPLHELADADGAAFVRDGTVITSGVTPPAKAIEELASWIAAQSDPVFESSALSRVYPPAADFTATGSGVLAVPISRDRTEQLIWFRREQKQTVRWAGDPRKPVTIEGDSARLHPRGSFALWEEEVRGTACPWEPDVLNAVEELRRAALDVFIARAEQLQQLNEELQSTVEQLQESSLELEKSRQEAERANRAKSDFLAMMSHELRTPLNAIGGYASLIGTGIRGPTTEQQRTDLGRIAHNQRHLLSLINNILSFAKVEAGAIQYTISSVDVASVLAGLDPIVAPQMQEKKIVFRVIHCEAGLFVRADEEKLRQILVNLLTNAMKFTPTGGRVEMACEGRSDVVEITVRDTGIGISAENLQRVFDPFVQVDRHATQATDQGTGLGLSISREMARAMQGDLSATSEVGVGSTFRVTLPRT